MDEQQKPAFDPTRHLTKVSGRDYLEVKWRLVWFQDIHPSGSIVTELVQHQNSTAVFRASVSWDTGDGIATRTGYGMESSDNFGDYLEKAETKAIGRALAALGFGTQFSAHEFGGEHENGRIADSPVSSPKVPARTRTTSVNTVVNVNPETGEIVDDDEPITGWTQFWDRVEAMGLPRDGKAFVALTGIQIGSDPALALEKTKAWHHDNPVQQAVV
jgi:hypothetical protein